MTRLNMKRAPTFFLLFLFCFGFTTVNVSPQTISHVRRSCWTDKTFVLLNLWYTQYKSYSGNRKEVLGTIQYWMWVETKVWVTESDGNGYNTFVDFLRQLGYHFRGSCGRGGGWDCGGTYSEKASICLNFYELPRLWGA